MDSGKIDGGQNLLDFAIIKYDICIFTTVGIISIFVVWN
jgi:hypothetical protein